MGKPVYGLFSIEMSFSRKDIYFSKNLNAMNVQLCDVEEKRILICGAGGFIGGHLVRAIARDGCKKIRAVDLKPIEQWHQVCKYADNKVCDLRDPVKADLAMKEIDVCFNLAADMGGIGFIESNKARCMVSVLINTNLLIAAQSANIDRFFFSSSACVYPTYRQQTSDVIALKETDAYPSDPEDGYGWEKLFSERMCRHFREDFMLDTRVARYHNVYGPYGTYDGGREKAPSALCRKVIKAKLSGNHEIEIWGDGEQTRSFMYIDDCIIGTRAITDSSFSDPINLGSDHVVTINQLIDVIEDFAQIKLNRIYNFDAPTGVRGRSSDNSMIMKILNWAPSISLTCGLESTYKWIYDDIHNCNSKGLF